MNKKEKQQLFNRIINYFLLSFKSSGWKEEKERRIEFFSSSNQKWVNLKESKEFIKFSNIPIFSFPNSFVGNNEITEKILRNIKSKNYMANSIKLKPYLWCNNCGNTDFDNFIHEDEKCLICNNEMIKIEPESTW